MEEMSNSYSNNVESEQNTTGGTRAIVVSLTEEVELDKVDFETMLEEIRIWLHNQAILKACKSQL